MSNQRIAVFDGPDEVRKARLLVLRGALRLEAAGMKRRGRSVYAIVKKEFGFKGSKRRVLEQLNELIEREMN